MKRRALSKTWRACAVTLALLCSFVVALPKSGAATNDVPVVSGGVQVMVPDTWVVFDGNEAGCSPQVMVLVNGAIERCHGTQPKGLVTFGPITLSPGTSQLQRIHGLSVRSSAIEGKDGGRVFTIAKYNAQLVLYGAANVDRTIEASIRVAPRVAVTAKGPLLATPSTWRWSTFEGLRFATPATWPVDRPQDIGCPWLTAYPGTSSLQLVQPGNTDAPCPGPSGGHANADALIVGGRQFQTVRAVQHVTINGVKFVVFRDDYTDGSGELDLRATTNNGSTFVRFTFKIRDSGKVDREILDSMHLIYLANGLSTMSSDVHS